VAVAVLAALPLGEKAVMDVLAVLAACPHKVLLYRHKMVQEEVIIRS
jgi:hypothetical protein